MPSGGSKFAIEAPYLFPAAAAIGAAPGGGAGLRVGRYDDRHHPAVLAIPLLGVARLDFRAIAGYCAIIFVAYATIVSAAFALAF